MADIPETFTEDELEQLSQKLSPEEVLRIQDMQDQIDREEMRKRLQEQAPDKSEVFSQISEKQYVEQKVEIDQGFTARFRTVNEGASDEVIKYALEHCDNNNDLFIKLKQRRRLAYGLYEVNGERMASADLEDISYEDLQMAAAEDDSSAAKKLREKADQTIEKLELLPRVMLDRLKTAFSVWEYLVFEKISGVDSPSEQAKN